jgi:hypothetical protein
MTVASFVAAQRTNNGVPHARCCRWLDVKQSTFYKWRGRPPTPRQQRRSALDAAVKESFVESGGTPGTYGSPRVWEDLVELGWAVSVKAIVLDLGSRRLPGFAMSEHHDCPVAKVALCMAAAVRGGDVGGHRPREPAEWGGSTERFVSASGVVTGWLSNVAQR